MPFGTNVQSATNLPSVPFVVDDGLWAQSAKKNTTDLPTAAWGTGSVQTQLPQVGIIGEILITLDGTLTIAEGGATTGDRWPYGILSAYSHSINGQQDLFGNVFGEDLNVREAIAFPAYSDDVDVYPGSVEGGDSLDAGTYQVSLHWRVPVATDLITLAGALYAQNPTTSIRLAITENTMPGLFSADATNASFTGVWGFSETMFIPAYDPNGKIIVPSGIQNLHSMTAVDLPLPATGQNPLDLVRGSGNLQRLYMAFRSSPTQRLSAAPNAASDVAVDALALSYGQTQQPYSWNPASRLLQRNNLDYGFSPPYDYLIIDTVKQDPTRDAIVYAGLTELKILATIDSAVTLSGGTAHLLQESLF